jgi:hypothetical protein
MILPMGDALRDVVSTAVTRTMCGGARVELKVQASGPEYDELSEYSGVVDFDSDRCRLDGERHVEGETAPISVILDGPTTYFLESDARWVFTRGNAGTRGMLHPCGLLDALVHAQTSAVTVGEHSIKVELDHAKLDAVADAGLAPDWQSTAVAEISSTGRIAHVVLTHCSAEDPESLIRVEWAISEPVQVGRVDLPPAETTISLAARIEEHDHTDA